MVLTNLSRLKNVPPAEEPHSSPPQACLALMLELEASLRGSKNSLLALDLPRIEQGTVEQIALIERLNGVLSPTFPAAQSCEPTGTAGSFASTRALENEFQGRCRRIMELVRLQAALLTRAQTKLRVLANTLAGPASAYGPSGTPDIVPPRDLCSV